MSMTQPQKRGWLSSPWATAIMIALFFGIAMFIRVYFPFDRIFSDVGIKFASNDAYYHMYIVDNLLRNFPHRLMFDPFINYPTASWVDIPPFFHWSLAAVIRLIGLGSPGERTVDLVAVYFPAVLGALTVIPVYFIGKELFGRWAGVVSSALIAVLPGEFLGRSILGFTDQHVAEVLSTTAAMMFLIMAIKTSRERQLSINNIRERDRGTILKPVIYSLLAGIFLGIYLLTWVGGLFFIFIVAVYFIVQFIMDHLRRQSTDYLLVTGVIAFLVSLLIFAPVDRGMLAKITGHGTLGLAAMGAALLAPIALHIISRAMTSKGIKPAYYPLALLGLGGVVLAILRAVSPSAFSTALSQFSMFNPTGPITIIEMQPFLFPQGEFSLFLPWGNFAAGFFLSLISVIILAALVIKRNNAGKNVLLIWSLVMLAATLGQRRFAYYLAVNVALLTGYFSVILVIVIRSVIAYFRNEPAGKISWDILESPALDMPAGAISKHASAMRTPVKESRRGRQYQRGSRIATHRATIVVSIIVIFFLVFYPNIKMAPNAGQARYAPSNAWVNSMYWLRENTPEPYRDPGVFYQLHQPPPPEETYKYPESAYGVTAWGDYGYWILRIAHRLPNRPPGPGGERIATLFTAQDENSDEAKDMVGKLDTAYVMLDADTATDKFWALAEWSGQKVTDFFETYYARQTQGSNLTLVNLFYPEYYRSMAVRMYNFDGRAVTPAETTVISYEERKDQRGRPVKLVTSGKTFSSYEEAVDYVSSQSSANYRIVGTNPFTSPVPLEALERFRLVHSSEEVKMKAGTVMPEVKIFEYVE